jgi:aryl sulfotransferase
MQRIVSMLIAGDAAPAPALGPWFDFRLGPPLEADLAMAEAMTSRRWLKSHLPFEALPVYEGVKFIHTARDGRDAAMSFHNHLRGFQGHMWDVIAGVSEGDPKFRGQPMPETPEDPRAYFHVWLEDGGAIGDPGASYWDMERSYWAARRSSDMLLVHYNDLKADRAAEIARIAAFLEIELAPAVMSDIVAAAGFDEMKKSGDALTPGFENIWVGGSQTFFNKGVNGRWKGVYDPADLALYERRVAEEFTPGLAAWLEGGRLVAGDPKGAAD